MKKVERSSSSFRCSKNPEREEEVKEDNWGEQRDKVLSPPSSSSLVSSSSSFSASALHARKAEGGRGLERVSEGLREEEELRREEDESRVEEEEEAKREVY